MNTQSKREHDVLVWGATGFTGQLVAEYLARHHAENPDIRVALGGRSREKLEGVRAGLAAYSPEAKSWPLLVADARDAASLDKMVSQVKVVATTVGPFALHGKELVAACARNGTHYCDLTGEAPFVREMIDAHHEEAKRTGAKLVNCCGFDSIPSDLGVLMLQTHAQAAHGQPFSEIHFFAGPSKGGISGGTIESALLLLEAASKDPRVRRVAGNPYGLVPEHSGRGPDGQDQRGPRWDRDLQRWTGPFVMAAINTRIVRRSNALLGYAYGKDFRYAEAMSFGKGPRGWMTAAAVTAGVTGFVLAGTTRPGRALLRKFLPGPGAGPSRETREQGHFQIKLVGHGKDERGAAVAGLGTVRGVSDPGYGETAKMLSEAAMCLARGEGNPDVGGGVLTPASALGMPLVRRLVQAKMTFQAEAFKP